MDIQTIKLDLINWLIHLKDEAIINKINSIKNNDNLNPNNNFFEGHPELKDVLEERLKEKTTDFVDARSSLNKLRTKHEL